MAEAIEVAVNVPGSGASTQSSPIRPLQVIYCGVCSLPGEYCEFSEQTDVCNSWWTTEKVPGLLNAVQLVGSEIQKQNKGKSSTGKSVKFSDEVISKISIQRAPRGNKWSTRVSGLTLFGIDAKQASKFFSARFACGCSVSESLSRKDSKVVNIQGDVVEKLNSVLLDKWKLQIKAEDIEILEDVEGD